MIAVGKQWVEAECSTQWYRSIGELATSVWRRRAVR